MKKLLEINHCRKSFGELPVLTDLSLSVEESQVLSIIGPSGSGKSTLLRCATLLETMDGGDLIYDGKYAARDQEGRAVYASGTELKEIRNMFGLVFQNFNLFPHYSVLKNIMEAPVLVQKRDRKEVEEEARELLNQMGLADRADAYPFQLSGGQQQRVSIARALAMNPKILFFDEPTSALDPELTGEILRVIRSLAEKKMTMVIVTHEMAFARDVSDYVVFMNDGAIVEQGDPREVIDHPTQERTIQFLRRLTET
ncbi:MAG: amino acid ABC transporter ATP-binding protein [Clostridia bacterium]|jgi:polar amino acid transport system ATP-binding protein|nr:amino acid ABC transporter ATP-binding protein [Clostridia bacterium]